MSMFGLMKLHRIWFNTFLNSYLQPGKIWRGKCKNMVGREQRKNTISIPLKSIFLTKSGCPKLMESKILFPKDCQYDSGLLTV
jgi:hypothetical protein